MPDPNTDIMDLLINRYGFSPAAAQTYVTGLRDNRTPRASDEWQTLWAQSMEPRVMPTGESWPPKAPPPLPANREMFKYESLKPMDLQPEAIIALEKQRLATVDRYNRSLVNGQSPWDLGPGALYLKRKAEDDDYEADSIGPSPVRREVKSKESPLKRAYRERDEYGSAIHSSPTTTKDYDL
jgi:hypothetical protein